MMGFQSYNSTDDTTGDLPLWATTSIPPIVFTNPSINSRLTAIVSTDAVGTAYVDQSFDGLDWDSTTSYTISVGNNSFEQSVFAPWIQVRYTNGAGDNSYLRLFIRTVPTRSNR